MSGTQYPLSRTGALCALVVASLAPLHRAEAGSSANPNALASSSAQGERPVLRGFDLNVTMWETSGLVFTREAYENQLTWYFEPVLKIGQQWFQGRWAEPLVLSGRLLVSTELAGNDATYRGATFSTPAILRDAPEQTAIARTSQLAANASSATGSIDGPSRQAWVSDLWLSLVHGRVVTIPRVGIDVSVGARVVLPTSRESRNEGLYAAPSLYLGLSRKIWRFTLDYGLRGVKYFYSSRVAPIVPREGTILVNGQEVTPYRPATTGVATPNWGLVNGLSLSLELPRGVTVSAYYFVFNVFAHALETCAVPDVPTANVCTDGALVGDARSRAQRDSQWFLLDVEWQVRPWISLSAGLSTFGPVRRPNGDLANPFVRVTNENYSTVFVAVGLNAEEIARAVRRRMKR